MLHLAFRYAGRSIFMGLFESGTLRGYSFNSGWLGQTKALHFCLGKLPIMVIAWIHGEIPVATPSWLSW